MSRITAIDAMRGFALAAIVVDHIPSSVAAGLTPRNFAVFDATEIFVFMSGLAVAMVWGSAAAKGGLAAAGSRLIVRSAKLYAAYVAVGIGLCAFAAALTASGAEYSIVWPMFAERLVADPAAFALEVATTRTQPNLSDVLLLYAWLLLVSPVLAEASRRFPLLLAAASAAVWWFAVDLNQLLPGNDGKGPTFNPFAWQAVFCLGLVGWFHHARARAALSPVAGPLSALAAAVLAAGLLATQPAWFGLPVDAVRKALEAYPKWDVPLIRIVSFACAAWLFRELTPGGASHVWRSAPIRALSLVGRNGLPCFCAGTGLSLAFDAYGRLLGFPAGHLIADALALFLLWAVARASERGSAIPAPSQNVVRFPDGGEADMERLRAAA